MTMVSRHARHRELLSSSSTQHPSCLSASQQSTQPHALPWIRNVARMTEYGKSCYSPPCRFTPRSPCHACMQPLPLWSCSRQSREGRRHWSRPYLGARRWQEAHCGVPSSLWLMQKRSSLKRLCTPCCTAPCISRLQGTGHRANAGGCSAVQFTADGQWCWLAYR